MNNENLTKIGLSNDQANVYLTLINHGSQTAGRIAIRSGLKRGLVYKVLEQLENLKIIEKTVEEGKATRFFPIHPSNLKILLEKKEQEVELAKNSFQTISPQLNSAFNLLSGKPNVQFFEGIKGMEEVLDDSLYAKGEILTYADVEAIQKYIPKVNEEYVAKRQKYGIKKKALVTDTPFNRNFLKEYAKEVTDIKMLPQEELPPFQTIMQIYDNKISYLTLTDEFMIGVIIEDSNIFKMHRYLFEHLWKITPEIRLTGN